MNSPDAQEACFGSEIVFLQRAVNKSAKHVAFFQSLYFFFLAFVTNHVENRADLKTQILSNIRNLPKLTKFFLVLATQQPWF